MCRKGAYNEQAEDEFSNDEKSRKSKIIIVTG